MRRLLDAVEELPEPYRSTIVERFFDDTPPRAIARRRGVPVNTVRTHLRRGLAELRRRLDTGEEQGRRDFLTALAPLLASPTWTSSALSSGSSLGKWIGGGYVSVQAKVAWIGVALLAVLGLGVRLAFAPSERARDEAAAATPTPTEKIRSVAEAVPAETSDSEDSSRRVAEGPLSAPTKTWIVRGQARLGSFAPFPRVSILARAHAGSSTDGEILEQERLVADETGAFAWALEPPSGMVTLELSAEMAGHDGDAAIDTAPSGGDPPQELMLFVYPLDLTLVGRVLDGERRPIEAASVSEGLQTALTDSEGRYRLAGTSHWGRSSVHVHAKGFVPESMRVVPLGPGEVFVEDVVLARGCSLSGVVLDDGGAPVPDVEIVAWGIDEMRVKSDHGGVFVLEDLDPTGRALSLYARKQGFCDQRCQVDETELRAGKVEWTLAHGTPIRGQVRDASGAPVPRAWLCVGIVPDATPRVDTWSKDDGSFEFATVSPGESRLWVFQRGFAPVSRPLDVPVEGALEGIDVVLDTGHFLSGRVTDSAGKPLAGVWVCPTSRSTCFYAPVRYTDQEGRFRMNGLSADPFRIEFLMKGYTRSELNQVTLDREDLEVQLRPSGVLAGRVVDGLSGEPIESFRIRFVGPAIGPAEVALRSGSSWSGEGATYLRTDGYWRCEARELEIGAVVGIEARAEGYAPAVMDHVVIAPESDLDPILLQLFSGSRIVGQVVGGEVGDPVANALVRAFRVREPTADEVVEYSARTDEAGRFALEGVSGGALTLAVDHPEWVRAFDGPIDVPSSGVVQRRIVLGKGARITGRLLDFDGQPRADEAMVLFAMKVPGDTKNIPETRTDSEGAFAFDHLLPGQYDVSWKRSFGESSAISLRCLAKVEKDAETRVELRPAGRAHVVGSLHAEEEVPDSIPVYLMPSPFDSQKATDLARTHHTVSDRGAFAFEYVEAGTYTVFAFAPKLPGSPIALSGQASIEVPADGEVSVRIELRPR